MCFLPASFRRETRGLLAAHARHHILVSISNAQGSIRDRGRLLTGEKIGATRCFATHRQVGMR